MFVGLKDILRFINSFIVCLDFCYSVEVLKIFKSAETYDRLQTGRVGPARKILLGSEKTKLFRLLYHRFHRIQSVIKGCQGEVAEAVELELPPAYGRLQMRWASLGMRCVHLQK